MKRAALILKSGLVRLMIGQALAFATLDRFDRPFFVADLAIVISKIELRQITMQMLFATMLVHAFHAALED
jgi:hypothetical protein